MARPWDPVLKSENWSSLPMNTLSSPIKHSTALTLLISFDSPWEAGVKGMKDKPTLRSLAERSRRLFLKVTLLQRKTPTRTKAIKQRRPPKPSLTELKLAISIYSVTQTSFTTEWPTMLAECSTPKSLNRSPTTEHLCSIFSIRP